MEIRSYFGVIGRYWWLVLLVGVAAAAGAAVADYIRPPAYSAHARVALRPSPTLSDERTIVDLMGQLPARSLVGTFAQAFTSADVQSQAQQAAGLSRQDADKYPLEANVLPDSIVIELRGTGPDPSILANYINATASATITNTKSLFRVAELVPLEPARAPEAPSSPLPMRDIPLAAALGLAVGLLLALTVDYLRGPRLVVPAQPPVSNRIASYAEVDR